MTAYCSYQAGKPKLELCLCQPGFHFKQWIHEFKRFSALISEVLRLWVKSLPLFKNSLSGDFQSAVTGFYRNLDVECAHSRVTALVPIYLDGLIFFQIWQKRVKICAAVPGQNNYQLLNIIQIINKTAVDLVVYVYQRLDIFQIIRIGVIVRERNKRHFSKFMTILCSRITGIRHHKSIVIEQTIL